MRLLEYEGKRLLDGYGLPVPAGAVWPNLPDIGERPAVVKAQVREGRRGKRGGIRFVTGLAEVPSVAEEILSMRLGAEEVERIYVEERLDVAQELYLAIVLDRDNRSPALLASRHGGVDVEATAPGDMVRLAIDPLVGPQPAAVDHVLKAIGLTGEVAEEVRSTIDKLHRAYVAEDATLLEINPLIVTRAGRVVAADARVVLDDHARFRHPGWPAATPEGTPFERAVARLGAVGVELEPGGDVVVITSGAGLMMATLDQLGSGGASPRAGIDLGGAVFGEGRVIGEIIGEALGLAPRVVFVNALFQLASCRRLAEGVRAALEARRFGGRVVVRLAGKDADEAGRELRGLTVLRDFEAASRAVIGAIGEQSG